MKLTEKTLQEKISFDQIGVKYVYYSFADKSNKMLGSKRRLIVFSPNDDFITYLPEDTKPPFEDMAKINGGLKGKIQASKATVTRQAKSKILKIKGALVGKSLGEEWQLEYKTQALAQEWVSILVNHKISSNPMAEKPNQSPNKNNPSPTKPPTNTNTNPNNSLLNPNSIGPKNNNNQIYDEDKDKDKQGENQASFLLTDSKAIVTNPNPNPKYNSNIDNLNLASRAYEHTNSRVNYNYNDSRVSNPQESRYKPSESRTAGKKITNDWNYKFLLENTLQIVLDFQKQAQKIGQQKIADFQKNGTEEFQQYRQGNIVVIVTESFTDISRFLKSQFRNYHYILECTQDRLILGVPLVALIEHQGYLAQVKAAIPKQALPIKSINDFQFVLKPLEEKCKILTVTFNKGNCKIYDLSEIYGTNGELPLLYVDGLNEYLPELTPSRKELRIFSMRPQLLAYNVSGKIVGGNLENSKNSKLQNDIFGLINDEIIDLAQFLSSQDLYITNIADLKELLHYRGVNMKLLFKLLMETKNKFVKKYVQTCVAAKIVKDTVYEIIKDVVSQKNASISPEEIVEDQIRAFIEGHSSSNSQMWKRLSMAFRSQYGISLSTHQLEGGFFLGCLMTLIPAEYDLRLLNKNKVIFQDTEIIGQGFVRKLKPKVKSYYRFQNHFIDIAKYSKKDEVQCRKMIEMLQLQTKPIPQSYTIHDEKKYILAYLSDFVDPQPSAEFKISNPAEIYSLVNAEPPSTATIKITLNYLGHKLMAAKQTNSNTKQLEDQIDKAIDIVNYWLGQEHPQICQFYDKLSGLKMSNNEVQEGLAILERSRQIAQKTEAKHKGKLGSRYFILGEQYLRSGSKKDALQNLQRARECLNNDKDREHEYALTLMKLASLDLNAGKVAESIALAEQALKNGQSCRLKDRYMLKIYQILSRGHQIQGNKDDLKKIGLKCSKRFSETEDPYIYCEMIKISLTGVFAKISPSKAKHTLLILKKVQEQGRVPNQQQSVNELMKLSKERNQPVIERMLTKIDFSQKIWADMEGKRPLSSEFNQFVLLLSLSAGAVGIDFLEGLEAQKQFE